MNRLDLLNDSEEAFRSAFDGRQVRMWTALPGIVTAVDFSKMTCSVQPAIQASVVNEDGSSTRVNLPLLLDVPIVFPSAGGFTITFPLAINDEVLVIFSSRCIDAWWQSGGVQRAMEARMHDLSDGFAIPGPKSVPKVIGSISSTALQIRNNAGTSYIEMGADGKIKLVSSAEVEIPNGLKVGSISFATHVHSGVTSGGSNTGGPV